MSDLHGSNSQNPPLETHGRHYRRVHDAIPAALEKAPLARLKTLPTLKPKAPEWYGSARQIDRLYLKGLMDEQARLQGVLDDTLGNLQHDINAFTEPLLKTSLQTTFSTVQNFDELTLQLEVPSTIVFGIDTGASRIRYSSLLEAALHNFEEYETQAGAFGDSSGVYRPDQPGRSSLEPAVSVAAFASMCRTLDIGGQYQRHIQSVLLPDTEVARVRLQQDNVASEKASFHVAALIALLRGDISGHAYAQLGRIREGQANVTLYEQPLLCHRLSLMGFRLTGITLFSAVSDPSAIRSAIDALTPATWKLLLGLVSDTPEMTIPAFEQFKLLQTYFANGSQGVTEELLRREDIHQQSRLSGSLIAYVPDDPDHPLKEYSSFSVFMQALLGQLRNKEYQAFFSRFVAQQDKGLFFTRVNERLTTYTWHEREPLDPGPWWRETAVENPDAEPITNQIAGDLWIALFVARRDKAIADARLIAVPTDDEDATSRFKRLTSYLSIGWNVFNFAAMLVPGLGEALLGLMIAQMLAELVEGVEDWRKGDKEEAAAYINGVLINFAQLALMSAGHVLPSGGVTPIKVSPFVEGLKPVEVGGKSRLWNPDLAPYEHRGPLPEGLKPNDLGLMQHQGQEFVALADKYYRVRKDPLSDQYRIAHPERADTYTPELKHNGSGAWSHEVEQPQTWQGTPLMRRLGHRVSQYSDTELEQIRRVSGIDDSVLRRMHVDNQPPATILEDTLQRYDTYRKVEGLIAGLNNGAAVEEPLQPVQVMHRYGQWPDNLLLQIVDGQGGTLGEFGPPAGKAEVMNVVLVEETQVRDGQLLQRLLERLDQRDTNTLLGQRDDAPLEAMATRVESLRSRIAEVARQHKAEWFADLYRASSSSSDPRLALIQSRFPSVPSSAIEQLLAEASSTERQQMSQWNLADALQTRPIPLRLSEALRSLQREVRVSRAYEGLYLQALMNRDTESLLLGSLEKLPGWSNDLRLEVREGTFRGGLRASVGPEDAASRKVLVRDELGQYAARDQDDGQLHGPDDFYAALQHALPDQQRTAIGLPHVGQGADLQALLDEHLLTPIELRAQLRMQPVKPGFRAPQRLADGRLGYPLSGRGAGISPQYAAYTARARSLFPGYLDGQIERFVQSLGADSELYLTNFEAEFQRLLDGSQRWVDTPTTRVLADGSRVAVEPLEKKIVAELLRRSWQKLSARFSAFGYPRGYELILKGRRAGALPALEADFERVEFVDLSDMDLVAAPNEFLDSFPDVRWLDLRSNRLVDVPTQLEGKANLVGLNLSSNNIRLTADEASVLSSARTLKKLQLSHNPLQRTPDFSQMTELTEIRLQGTGISQWPSGVENLRQLEMLDLRDNQLTGFPEWAVNPPAEQAAVIDRLLRVTELNGNPLSEQGLQQYADILERIYQNDSEIGLVPAPADLPAERGAAGGELAPSTQRVDPWLTDASDADKVAWKELWTQLEQDTPLENGSEEFFRLLEKLRQSEEYRKAYPDLQARVWTVLKAASENAELRAELFEAAGEPQTCSDRAALVFSTLEVKVQIHNALARVGDRGAGLQLLKLAKGLFRLDQVEEFALLDIQEQVRAIMRAGLGKRETGRRLILLDQIEVRLSYRVGLRDRLELPGQPTRAQYTGLQYVSEAKLNAAVEQIASLNNSQAVIDSIAGRDFWVAYLKDKYRSRFDLAVEPILERLDALEDTKETLTSQQYNTQISALSAEAEEVKRKLVSLLTPQEILELEDVTSR